MNARIWICAICILIVSLTVTAVSFAANEKAEDKPGAETVANGPKEIPPGWEKIVFIHYKKAPGKPQGTPGKPKPPKDADCYGFLARGVKWNDDDLPLTIEIDGTNDYGVTPDEVAKQFSLGTKEWDQYTNTSLFGTPVLVNGSVNEDEPDTHNMVVFGDLSYPGAIAVTIVWGYFGGPPSTRKIIEFDMIFDQVDFAWGICEDGSEDFMDIQNIATHELGHAVGLDDLYETACAEVTMYGYSTEGEIKKRDIEADDITGLKSLYDK